MDGVIDFLENLTSRLHQDFDELIGKDTNKKRFVKVLTRIFALLLNKKSTRQIKSKEYSGFSLKVHWKYVKNQSDSSSNGARAPVLDVTSK